MITQDWQDRGGVSVLRQELCAFGVSPQQRSTKTRATVSVQTILWSRTIRTNLFLQNLTDSNKATLASVGDNRRNTIAPTAVAANVFSVNKILYRKIDTLGLYRRIYIC